jgi:type I restriction-modification system DNA methylase subunit
MKPQPRDTEVDAYVFIKENLRTLGWDVRNPAKAPEGQVYTQNECLANPEIKRWLDLKRPENIVKVTEKVLWVIEAKRTRSELGKALQEATQRASILNRSKHLQVRFISGVAGNYPDGFVIRTQFVDGVNFAPVKLNDVDISGLLSPGEARSILQTGNPDLQAPSIDVKLFLSKADRINEILHLGAVNPHQRAGVMAALLLSMISETGPNVEERSPSILIGDINSRVQHVLKAQGKSEFSDLIKISLPATPDNHVKFRQALVDTLQELDILNIRSAMNSGADWLGSFYEVFLKYANWAQDLGIVLTPRNITRWAAQVMDVQVNDIVYDPTSGTGGFLVAAFDYVKKSSNPSLVARFKQNCLFGVEQDSGVAALAVVNMIFRGDGKNNIKEGNCFAQFLAPATNDGVATAKFVAHQCSSPPATKVMMNPPFALKRGSEKEYKFVDQALAQLQDGGILFSVLPYSAMVKPGSYLEWRRNSLLQRNTLLSVVTFPQDVFYPIGVTTVGIFVKKGVPHPKEQNVLWIRAMHDGLLKSKRKRLPSPKEPDDLGRVAGLLRAFIHDPQHPVENIEQFQKACPIDFDDRHLELVAEAYLDQANPTLRDVFSSVESGLRDCLAYLIKINRPILKPELLRPSRYPSGKAVKWRTFSVTDIFELDRGDFHSIADLDADHYPTISRVSTDNGCVGFYDKPDDARLWPPGTVTVSSVTGDAFVQPVTFIATDNVVLCTLRGRYKTLSPSSLFFIQAMLNHIKWRYSYGRQCYKTKYSKTQVILPISEGGELDEPLMSAVVEGANHWPLIQDAFRNPSE